MTKRLPDTAGMIPSAGPYVTISVRLSTAHREALEELARRKRMQTGDNTTVAELIRTAVAEYLHRET